LNAEYLTNFLGTPLLKEDAFEIWQEEQCHVKCLQDPVDVMLYTQTGAISMGGISLQVYRFFLPSGGATSGCTFSQSLLLVKGF
jgi:hypothetical protein